MNKSDFFLNEIKDNNYEGISLSSINYFSKTGQNSKDNIFKYLQELYLKFASLDIKELTNTIIIGDEFEANIDQNIFELKGQDFDSTKIYTFNLVGSIRYKKEIFNINSRFGNVFLEYMIASSHGFLELEKSGGFSKDISLAEWIMIYYFKIKLKDAFNLGMYKTYQTKNEDLLSIRGQIDMDHYIKKDFFDGKTRCNYKEHSFNNDTNYIISLAINKIFKIQKYVSIVNDIHTIKNAFNQVEYKKKNIKLLSNIKVKNPFYGKYNEVFKLAYKILNEDFGSNGEDEFSAFLFDISLLFEHHIRSLLKTKYNLGIKNQKEFQVPNGNRFSHIFPDVIIYHDDGSISIYDVKYKHFGKEVNREDRFQLISYVAIYLQKYKIKECGFIYPADSSEQETKEQVLQVSNVEIPFKIIFYDIVKIDPQEKTYDKKNTFFIEQQELDKKFLEKFNN